MEYKYDGYCGLYCGACRLLLAVDRGWLPEYAKEWDLSVEDVECYGCKSEIVALFCRNCKIKDCAREKGIEFCIECDEYPCKMYLELKGKDAMPTIILQKNLKRIKKIGKKAWLREQKERWTCKNCGESFTNVDAICRKCGKIVYTIEDESKDISKETD